MPNSAQTDTYSIDSAAIAAALWRRKWRIVLSTLVVLALTFVVLMFVPKTYQSSASILVERRDTGILSGAGAVSGVSGGLDSAAVASQMEVIRSRDTLLDAITSAKLEQESGLAKITKSPLSGVFALLGLGSKPQTGAALTTANDNRVLANVRKGLTVIQERDSRVITIIFRAGDPRLAAKVANAIAETYVRRRAGQVVGDTADATAWLKIEIDKLRTRVAAADSKVAAFKVDKDLFVGQNNTSLTDQQLSAVSAQISAAQERQSAAQSRAQVIGKIVRSGRNVEAVPEIANSAVVQKLIEQRGALEGERAQKLATLLPGHPLVKALDAQIAALDRQVAAQARRVASSLQAQAQVEADVVQSLKDELARLKVSASGDARNTVTLSELQREAKAERDLLESYLIKYRDAASRTDAKSALPDVRIVSYAAASPVPSSPQIGLIMLAVFLASFVGQIGYILFAEMVSGRALVSADADEGEVRLHEPLISNVVALHPEPAPMQATQAVATQAAAPEVAAPEVLPPHFEDVADTGSKSADIEEAEGAEGPVTSNAEPERKPPTIAAPTSIEDDNVDLEPVSSTQYAHFKATAKHVPGAMDDEQSGNVPERDEAVLPDLRAELGPLLARIAQGADRAVFLADMAGHEGSDTVIDILLETARRKGQSLAIVDAAGGPTGSALGLTDLCAGHAGFGDIVQRTEDGDVALIPWGQGQRLDPRSRAPVTLVQALLDIFDLVVVATGRPGMASSLFAFSGVDGPLIVGGAADAGPRARAAIKVDAAALGFSRIQMLENETTQARVA